MNKTKKEISRFNPPVFYTASAIIVALVVYAAAFPENADVFFKSLQNSVVTNGSWFYVLSVATILLVIVYFALSKFGEIKLGPDHAKPDYTNITWFAMLFSAGMGIGLMFFGVAEPVMHFLSPPVGEGQTIEAAKNALRITLFHWGFHGWAIYAIVAIILAFFSYRHNLPLTLRSALYPIIGDKIYGPLGNAVDIFAVIGTVFGVATSLGFGVLQVNSGLNYLWGIPVGTSVQVILIVFVTLLATISVATGLDKGIKILSQINMGMAVLLMFFVLFLGNTVDLMQELVQNTGAYLSNIMKATFNLYAYEKTDWIGGWTIFYWAWWLSWSPFVGLFIARISRGRTIREFITGVLFVPTGFIIMWMTFFGNSAINMIHSGITELGDVVSKDVSVALYQFLSYFPFSGVLSFIATIMVIVFFVTSADSGAMVVDMLCSDGKDNTPLWQRLYWALGEGVIASVLLLAGGLGALQTMTVASALPFTIVLLIACYGLIKALRIDVAKKDSLQFSAVQASPSIATGGWKERLHNIIDYPNRANVKKFLKLSIKPSMQDIADELKSNDFIAQIIEEDENGLIKLVVGLGEEMDFVYGVKVKASLKPNFSQDEIEDSQRAEEEFYFRAEVFLREGGQNYDIMGWSKDAVRNDIIEQYHKHMHFLHLLK